MQLTEYTGTITFGSDPFTKKLLKHYSFEVETRILELNSTKKLFSTFFFLKMYIVSLFAFLSDYYLCQKCNWNI